MGGKIRLDKLLADCGKGTRSEVKKYIKNGLVTVNGETVRAGDIKVDKVLDTVTFDGDKITFEEYVYYMLHKPAGVVSATTDSRDKTVIELITEDKPRDLFPVGRLDKDTEGLLLITNDGKLSNALLSPKKHVDKTYFAKVERVCESSGAVASEDAQELITEVVINQFVEGIDIGDEKLTAPAKLEVISQTGDEAELCITITEGRYHQVKRMFEAIGMRVIYLKRLSMGGVHLDDGLAPGEYRRLTEGELSILRTDRNGVKGR